MPTDPLERDESAIIIFEGSINPAIITTRWLAAVDLVDPTEADAAHVRFMDADFSRFDVSHFRVEARRDRLTVGSTKSLETFDPIKDFVEGIFEVLIHTPITAVSLNRLVHMVVRNGWASLSRQLLDADSWASVLMEPSLSRMTLSGKGWSDHAQVEVTIEESQYLSEAIYVVATDRTDLLQDAANSVGAEAALTTLRERWQPWLRESEAIISHIGGLA